MKRKILWPLVLLPLGLFLATSAQALSLGDLQLASHLGQRFSATIVLSGDDLGKLEPDCFSPAQPISPGSQGLPWISRYNISLRKGKEGARLLLTTSKALDEPLLTLAIRVGCGVDVVREYAVLLSPPPDVAPPVTRARVAAPAPKEPLREKTVQGVKKAPAMRHHTWVIGTGESVQSLAASLYPQQPGMRKAFARAVYQANPELAMEYSSHDTLPEGLALEIPDLRALANSAAAAEAASAEMVSRPAVNSRAGGGEFRKGKEGVADRLVIAVAEIPDVYPGDAVFRERLHDTQMDVNQLSRFMAEQLQAGEAPSSDPAILELQTRLASLQLALEKIRQAEMAGTPPAPEPVVPAKVEPVTPPVVKPVPPAVVKADEPAVLKAPAAPLERRVEFWNMLLLGGAMGSLGIALGVWLAQRKSASRQEEAILRSSLTQTHATFPRPQPGMMGVFKPQIAEEEVLVEPRFNLPQVRELSSEANPLEFSDLTDFMLATGRADSAAQFLQDFIEAEPDKALTPWIKLLSSYQKLGKEKEFRWVARQLHQHFNVTELRWGEDPGRLMEAPEAGKPVSRSIEDMPHICARVTSLWGKPDCYPYLEGLLRDNREGRRQGFSLQVVQEILFLMHLLQQETYAEKRLI